MFNRIPKQVVKYFFPVALASLIPAFNNKFGKSTVTVLFSVGILFTTMNTIFAQCARQPSGMVAWFKGEGNVDDVFANHSFGAFNGTYSAGKVNQSMNFNGINNYAYFSSSSRINIPNKLITFASWIKPSTISGSQIIFSRYDSNFFSAGGVSFYFSTNGGKLYFQVNESDTVSRSYITSNSVLSAGVYQHVAATFDLSNQQMQIFVNGNSVPLTLVNTGTVTTFQRGLDTAYYLGAIKNGDQFMQFFNGQIDEAQMFNLVIPSSEIQAIYNAGSIGVCNKIPVSGRVATINGGDLTDVPIITGDLKTFQTSGNGLYSIGLDETYNHIITPKLSTHSFSPINYSFTPLISAQTGKDFTATLLNDNFASAIQLSGESGEIEGSSRYATRELGEPLHAGVVGGTSVWYKWRALRNGQFIFSLGGSKFDTVLAIYKGTSVGALTQIASNDNIPGATFSRTAFTAEINTDYYFAIDGAIKASGYFKMIYNASDYQPGFTVSGEVKGHNGLGVEVAGVPGATIKAETLEGVVLSTSISGTNGTYSIVIPQGVNSFKLTAFDQFGSSFTVFRNITQNQTYNFSIPSYPDTFINSYGIIGRVIGVSSLDNLTVSATGPNISGSLPCPITETFTYSCLGLLPNGTYTVTASHPSVAFSPTSYTFVKLERNQENISFINRDPGFTISGKVTFEGTPLIGVNVSTNNSFGDVLSTDNVATDANGNYSIKVPAGYNYRVSASLYGYSLTPTTASTFQNLQSNQTVNFSATTLCSYNLPQQQQTVPASGGFYSFNISTTAGCAWEAMTTSAGFTISTPLSYGSGEVWYYVEANTSSTPRTGIITIAGQTVTITQAGASTASITGTVSYGIIQSGQNVAKAVPDAILNVIGSPQVNSATTDNLGRYNLSGFGSGEYTVKPEKTGYLIGTNAGISSFDATLILRCVAAGTNNCTLTDNQKIAADTNSINGVTSFDATLVLRYVAAGGQTNATNNVGNWKFFDPVTRLDSRTYQSVTTQLENQNFEAVLVGDVNGSWMPPQSSFSEETEQAIMESADEIPILKAEEQSVVISAPETTVISETELFNQANQTTEETASLKEEQSEIELSIPENVSAETETVLTVPVLLTNKANKQISAYSFAIRFDPDVLQPIETAIETTNTLSENGFTIVTDTNQRGRIGIAASALNNTIQNSGTLLYLRFKVLSKKNKAENASATEAILAFETAFNGGNSYLEDRMGNNLTLATRNGLIFVVPGETSSISEKFETIINSEIRNGSILKMQY